MANQSDQQPPLFQNTDAQERAYAPEQRAESSARQDTATSADDMVPANVPLAPVRGDLSSPVVPLPALNELDMDDRATRDTTDSR